LATQVLTEYKQQISSFELEPSRGGCFELTVDGQLIYSKLETGEFPKESSIIEDLQQRLS
jgi:selenoprotein W-related protein